MTLEKLIEEARNVAEQLGDEWEDFDEDELREKLTYYLGSRRIRDFFQAEKEQIEKAQEGLLEELRGRISIEGLSEGLIRELVGFPVVSSTRGEGIVVEVSESLYGGDYFYRVDMGNDSVWVEGLVGYRGRCYNVGEESIIFKCSGSWEIGDKVAHKVTREQGIVVGKAVLVGRVCFYPILWDGLHKERLDLVGRLV